MLFLFMAAVAAFATTLFMVPQAITFLRNSGIVGIDQQKEDTPTIPTSGGVTVIFGFLVGISVFLGLSTFAPVLLPVAAVTIETQLVLAALAFTLAIGLIGLIDDIHVDHNGREEKGAIQVRVGLAQRYKYGAPLLAALPLMVVKAGTSTMLLPVIGAVDFGILYPLVLIPIGVTCVVNAANMLAGHNGLESGLGTIAMTALGIVAYANGSMEAALISFAMAAALLAFFVFNSYPAHILPGDSLTYAFGAAFISAVIIGNLEKFGILLFLPWILEAFLKLRSGFQASSLGILLDDGSLMSRHDAIYSLTHIFMRLRMTEAELVRYAMGTHAVFSLTILALFFSGMI